MLHLTLNHRCAKCYRDEWIPNGCIHHYNEDLEGLGPEDAAMLVPVSTTRHYRCNHCGQDTAIEVPFEPDQG